MEGFSVMVRGKEGIPNLGKGVWIGSFRVYGILMVCNGREGEGAGDAGEDEGHQRH